MMNPHRPSGGEFCGPRGRRCSARPNPCLEQSTSAGVKHPRLLPGRFYLLGAACEASKPHRLVALRVWKEESTER